MVLVEYGADIYQPDNDGDTPLSLSENTDLKQTIMGKWSTSITPHTHHTPPHLSHSVVSQTARRTGTVDCRQ